MLLGVKRKKGPNRRSARKSKKGEGISGDCLAFFAQMRIKFLLDTLE